MSIHTLRSICNTRGNLRKEEIDANESLSPEEKNKQKQEIDGTILHIIGLYHASKTEPGAFNKHATICDPAYKSPQEDKSPQEEAEEVIRMLRRQFPKLYKDAPKEPPTPYYNNHRKFTSKKRSESAKGWLYKHYLPRTLSATGLWRLWTQYVTCANNPTDEKTRSVCNHLKAAYDNPLNAWLGYGKVETDPVVFTKGTVKWPESFDYGKYKHEDGKYVGDESGLRIRKGGKRKKALKTQRNKKNKTTKNNVGL